MADLVVVSDVLEGMFGKSVSVKTLVFFSDLVYSSVEGETADIGLNDLVDSGLVFIGDIVLVGSNEGVNVYPSSTSCIWFVLHPDVLISVKRHSNPLK